MHFPCCLNRAAEQITDSAEERHSACSTYSFRSMPIMSHTSAGQKSLVMLSGKENLHIYSHTEHFSLMCRTKIPLQVGLVGFFLLKLPSYFVFLMAVMTDTFWKSLEVSGLLKVPMNISRWLHKREASEFSPWVFFLREGGRFQEITCRYWH